MWDVRVWNVREKGTGGGIRGEVSTEAISRSNSFSDGEGGTNTDCVPPS